jgi:hypothetical protein
MTTPSKKQPPKQTENKPAILEHFDGNEAKLEALREIQKPEVVRAYAYVLAVCLALLVYLLRAKLFGP